MNIINIKTESDLSYQDTLALGVSSPKLHKLLSFKDVGENDDYSKIYYELINDIHGYPKKCFEKMTVELELEQCIGCVKPECPHKIVKDTVYTLLLPGLFNQIKAN